MSSNNVGHITKYHHYNVRKRNGDTTMKKKNKYTQMKMEKAGNMIK
jgi:hypothetical protein